MADQIQHYESSEAWSRDLLAGGPPREEHNVAHDGRVLDTREKALAYLQEIGALDRKPSSDA